MLYPDFAMDDQPDCYMAGALATMLRLSRVAGVAPLKFVKKGSGYRVSVSPRWSYYGYLVVTVIIMATIGSLIYDLQLEQVLSTRMSTNTRRIVWIVDVACMLLIAGTSVYGAPEQMRAMIVYMNRIEKINFELNIREWPVRCEKKTTRFLWFWVTTTIVLTTVDYLIPIGAIMENHINQHQIWICVMYSFYYCCYWILQLRELNIALITLHVMYGFRSINNKLKNLLQELTDSNEMQLLALLNISMNNTTKKRLTRKVIVKTVANSKKFCSEGIQKTNHQEIVRRLSHAYANTCDVVRDVNNSHGLIVLIMLGSFLLHLVCTPYYLIMTMINNSNSLDMNSIVQIIYVGVQVIWCFYHSINLLMIIEPCHLTQIEMETTCELVSHLIRCTDSMNDPMATELEIFYKHIFLHQASYSAMHVTTISRSLVATILGSITTYLVIIIQL